MIQHNEAQSRGGAWGQVALQVELWGNGSSSVQFYSVGPRARRVPATWGTTTIFLLVMLVSLRHVEPTSRNWVLEPGLRLSSVCNTEPPCPCAKPLQSCLTLCEPTDCGPPGSSVHGILQARVREWGAIAFSRGPSQPRDWTHVSYTCLLHGQEGALPLTPLGKPQQRAANWLQILDI